MVVVVVVVVVVKLNSLCPDLALSQPQLLTVVLLRFTETLGAPTVR